MVLYQDEWRKVLTKLESIPRPTVELATLTARVRLALQTRKTDPFYMAITDYQEEWVESRCRLVTLHKRPARGI